MTVLQCPEPLIIEEAKLCSLVPHCAPVMSW